MTLGFLKMIIYISVMGLAALRIMDYLIFADYFFSLQILKLSLILKSYTEIAKGYFQFDYFYY